MILNKKINFTFFIVFFFSLVYGIECLFHGSHERPNIVFILVDDVGRNDFSLHGSNQIPTPNIDALGYNGVILNKHYSMHICTPSRAAFLTGVNPIRLGLQGSPLSAGEPRALLKNVPTLAEKLSELGYRNYLVGKWHLGHQNRSVTPLGKGFHHHYGYWSGFIGYFNHRINEKELDGLDMHRNFAPAFNDTNKYATDLFTEESVRIIKSHNKTSPFFLFLSHLGAHTGSPNNGTELGVPNEEEANRKYSYIEEPKRRLYAEIVNRLDQSVGRIVRTLSSRKLLDNTILVFLSDNGAQTFGVYENFGSNWPFRGQKQTLFEGGVRNIGLIWSKRLKKKKHIESNVFHIIDWMPTLYSAAGGDVKSLGNIDGINQFPLLFEGQEIINRPDILLNIDEVRNYAGILSSDGRYKLTQGHYGAANNSEFFGDPGRSSNIPNYNILSVLNSPVNHAITLADPLNALLPWHIIQLRNDLEIKQSNAPRTKLNCDLCLFDLVNDPTETTDIANEKPEIVKKLTQSLEMYRQQLIPQLNKPVDPNSDPKFCQGVWFTWLDPVHKCDWTNPTSI